MELGESFQSDQSTRSSQAPFNLKAAHLSRTTHRIAGTHQHYERVAPSVSPFLGLRSQHVLVSPVDSLVDRAVLGDAIGACVHADTDLATALLAERQQSHSFES
jgi:hypothetical protein